MSHLAKLPTAREFLRLGQDLDATLSKWRFMDGAVGAEDFAVQRRDSEEALIGCLNRIGERYRIVAGGFGVANRESNSFEIFRHYPEFLREHKDSLFQYQDLGVAATELFTDLKGFSSEGVFDYNRWMQSVFLLQRNEQTIGSRRESTSPIQVPEFFRGFGSSENFFLVQHSEIDSTLEEWISLWLSLAPPNSKTQVDRTPGDEDSTLLHVLRRGFLRLESDLSTEELSLLPEWEILRKNIVDPNTAGLLGNQINFILSRAVPSCLLKSTGRTHSERPFSESLLPRARDTYTRLVKIHSEARFPIVPYAIQRLLDKRKMAHFAVPLVRTKAYRFSVQIGDNADSISDLTSPETGLGTSVHAVIFLGTIEEGESLPNTHRRLTQLKWLLRIAGEPLADGYFYGGIIRRLSRLEGSIAPMTTFAHQIKHIGEAISAKWLVDLERWKIIQEEYGGDSPESPLRLARVSPAPILFDALSDTIRFWSLGSSVEDNFFDIENPNTDVPIDLQEVARMAWRLAQQSRLVQDFHASNFSEQDEPLRKAWNYVPLPFPLCGTNCDQLAQWRIAKESFNKDRDKNSWTLSGMLRVLVVAMENFLVHGRGARLEIQVTSEESTRYFVCNTFFDGVPKEARPATKFESAGYRGLEIIRFVCERFLDVRFGDEYWASEKFRCISAEGYRVRIPIGLPYYLHAGAN